MRTSHILHIGIKWEYQTYYSLEEDENIRHITHRKSMRISDILHIGRGWEYQSYILHIGRGWEYQTYYT
jgi:hypothetical protein